MALASPPILALAGRIRELAREKNAVILAHNYQIGDVQDVADFVGDSLGLSQQAAKSEADVIVFCGVHFMAETASILCPEKRVLIPDPEAGCSLSDTLTAEQLQAWKERYPDAVVVTYVNTSAAVKALSDYCCTSTNAVKVVQSIPANKTVLFGPDMFLGAYVSRVTGRKNLHLWAGECHVHAAVRPEDVERAARGPPGRRLPHPSRVRLRDLVHGVPEGQGPEAGGRLHHVHGGHGPARHRLAQDANSSWPPRRASSTACASSPRTRTTSR